MIAKTVEYRVWCDHDDCMTVLIDPFGRNATEAREFFRNEGWRRRKVGDDWRDLCPHHAGTATP